MDTMTYRKIFETKSGNMIGVIEEPIDLDPRKPLQDQRLVKIGVIDPIRAGNEPFPKVDADIVIQRLYRYIINVLKGE
jgi:hypothetical protein